MSLRCGRHFIDLQSNSDQRIGFSMEVKFDITVLIKGKLFPLSLLSSVLDGK